MGYESNVGGKGVGQLFGPGVVGGGTGVVAGVHGDEDKIIFDVNKDTLAFPYSYTLNADNYYMDELEVKVETADQFATGATLNISIDSGAGVTTAVPLDSTSAIVAVKNLATDTSLANKVGAGPVTVALSLNSLATASTVGACRAVVRYRRL